MANMWTWGGEYFGYTSEDSLFAYTGVEVGRIRDGEVYGADGRYLGEVRNNNRLITKLSKQRKRASSFSPRRHVAHVRYVNYVGYVMYLGYEDFPSPSEF
jgi:hypothetical protein